jgi:hypothetical protein
MVGRVLVYISLVFSITSAIEYVGLFAEAIAGTEQAKGNAKTSESDS